MKNLTLFDNPAHPQQSKVTSSFDDDIALVTMSSPKLKDIQTIHGAIIRGIVPAKSNCYRIIILKNKDKDKQHASLAKSPILKAYEKAFALQSNKYRGANIDSEFKIELTVYYPNRRSDLDNSLKVVLDCLQYIEAITNDNLCVEIHAKKGLDKLNPRVEFSLTKL